MNLVSALLSVAKNAASVGVIGGADGPTAVMVTGPSDLMNALTLAWQGMTGIFVVMVVISLIVYALSKLGSHSGKNDGGN